MKTAQWSAPPAVTGGQTGRGRAHALVLGVGVDGREDPLVGRDQLPGDVVGGQLVARGELPHRLDDDAAGDLARSVATHPVGDHEDPTLGERGVLVEGAHPTGVGRGAHPQHQSRQLVVAGHGAHAVARIVRSTCWTSA
ncbi:hypothetical protein LP422_21565 [Janibacter limosus]|uniref:Uncharacterized protein n=1 Tax=Janibacter limosus TaxID=53458 RepID=A0AC61U453_9MICO|nr:hypothetical protein [Janibacter limosus]UUZ44830.1 hypothetical protein LP422_21565 [Janibacter limosus]